MTDDGRYRERMSAAAAQVETAGLAGLLVTPSADLVYLAGYDPPPLERLTCLVLRPGAEPVLVVPELEKPRALASPTGSLVEVAAWPDGEDPYAMVGRVLGGAGPADRVGLTPRVALTDRTLAVH